MSKHVAADLYKTLGPDGFDAVGRWLRDVANEHALGVGDNVHGPSVAWLAEAVTFFDPKADR